MTGRPNLALRLLIASAALAAPAMATAATAAPAPPQALAVSAPGSTPLAKAQSGQVFVVQALTDPTVSVSIDGRTEEQVAAGEVLGPLSLTPGKHTVTVTGSDPSWTMDASVTTRAGGSSDVVLHRPASVQGSPTVTVYRNPTTAVPADKGRVMVAHTATVPPADIRVDGDVVFSNVANGEFATAEVPAGTHQVSIVPTGRTKPVLLGPLDLAAKAGTLTQVFAVGRPSNNSMDVVVHTLPVSTRGTSAPDEVNTGSAGLVAGLPVDTTGR